MPLVVWKSTQQNTNIGDKYVQKILGMVNDIPQKY